MSDSGPSWLENTIDYFISRRSTVLIIAAIATVLAWPLARQLDFDRSIESLYAKDDPHLSNYLRSKALFGGDEFAIVAYSDPNLFSDDSKNISPQSAKQLQAFSKRLSNIPGVQSESTRELAEALKFPYARSKVLELVKGVLLGSDGITTAVVLRLMPESRSSVSREQTIKSIRRVAAEHNLRAFVVGEPVQVLDMFTYVENDGKTLFRWSLGLLAIVILLLFRNLRWVILPLVIVTATIFWTEAILVLTQMQLSMVSSMLNSLVTIIGIATVTHITVHFREHRITLLRTDALKKTLTDLAPAIFWTCATTAVGFAALLSSHITPVRSFGIMMSLGTLLVLFSAATILPGGILIGRMISDPKETPAEKRLVGLLNRITDGVEHHPRLLVWVTIFVVLFAGAGFFRLEVETDFSKNFRKSSPIVQSLDFVETKLGGAGSWEVNFPAPQKLTNDYLDQVRQLSEQLRTNIVEGENGSLTKVISLTDGLDLVPQIPFVLNTLEKRLKMLENLQNEFVPSLFNADEGRMRIILRAKERQSTNSKNHLIEQVQKIARETFPAANTTGLFVLLTFLIDSLLRDQLVSFVLAATGICLMMTVAFRSFWIGLISLIPNLFPIVMVIGTMGWIGLPINIATAMIASVSMGLTVDSSIHYIAGYRRARQRGNNIIESLRETHSGVGRALVFANLALIVGFSVLTLSHFIPLVYFGILVSVAMFGGLIGNLVLLPLLLQWVEKGRE